MSENKTIYSNAQTNLTIDDVIQSNSALPLSDENFETPTPEQIKFLRLYLGLSQAKLGRFLGKTVSKKGCSAVRKWETRMGSPEHRAIDSNAWRRMLEAAGLCDIQEDLALVKCSQTGVELE